MKTVYLVEFDKFVDEKTTIPAKKCFSSKKKAREFVNLWLSEATTYGFGEANVLIDIDSDIFELMNGKSAEIERVEVL